MDQPLARIWVEFRENRIAVGALIVVAVIAFIALLAPLIAPQNPYDLASLVLMDARRPPGFVGSGGYVHILGTDAQGRDLFSAILYGLRISIQIGVAAGAVALVLGAALGTSAAYFGGRIEALIMRIVDLQLSFPAILLALMLSALLGKGITPATDLMWACWFTLTWVHAVHVLGGAIFTGWLAGPAFTMAAEDRDRWLARIDATRRYWLFVDLVWLLIVGGFHFV